VLLPYPAGASITTNGVRDAVRRSTSDGRATVRPSRPETMSETLDVPVGRFGRAE
jgi:hypothetical protein